jgi:hypothetical protein
MSDFEDDDDVNLPEEVDEDEDFDDNAANGGGPNAAKRARLEGGAESPAGAKPDVGLAAVPVAPPPPPPEATMSTQELMSKVRAVCTAAPTALLFLPPSSLFPRLLGSVSRACACV